MPPAHSGVTTIMSKDAKSGAGAAPAAAAMARDGKGAHTVVQADICVIGAGAGGLAVATGAAAVGQRVVLIEKHKLGGDSLNYGCVPSKALLASARRAHEMRTAGVFGISSVHPAIDYGEVRHHVAQAVAAVTPSATLERFTALGVMVVQASARFIDKATVDAGDVHIKARRFVIATGSSPAVPDIPGLDSVAFFTNETIFENARRLDRLIVIGGNAAALELAQAHLRLGSTVTVLEPEQALAGEDSELATAALRALRDEGLDIREGVRITGVTATREGVRLTTEWRAATSAVDGSHLLVVAGRKPNTSDLNLQDAGIKAGPRGIAVNAALRTSNRRVYAIGDVAGFGAQAHLAEYHARIFLKRVLFRLRVSADASLAPRVCFTSPEIAWVGLDEEAARSKAGRVNVLRWSYSENERALAEHVGNGHVKVITDAKGRILGAGIVGAAASELIQVWALAISQDLSIRRMTEWVAPHPTLSEINRSVAMGSYAAAAGSPFVRWLVRLLGRLG